MRFVEYMAIHTAKQLQGGGGEGDLVGAVWQLSKLLTVFKRLSKHLPRRAFAAEWVAHDHKSVTHKHHLVHLRQRQQPVVKSDDGRYCRKWRAGLMDTEVIDTLFYYLAAPSPKMQSW